MKNKSQITLITCNIFLIIVLLIFVISNYANRNLKIVYVENDKLFNKFSMTRELKSLGENEFNNKKLKLDSLYIKLQSPKISDSEKKILMQRFVQEKEELNQFNEYFASEQSSKIWARIKSYSSEFSQENKYQLIIGSENKGNVLYAAESIDVTNDLLTYINKKYEGVK